MKIIERFLKEKDATTKEIKNIMQFAKLTKDDLYQIMTLSGAITKQDLLFELEKILIDGGVK